jgi:hypothetical protein
MCPTKFDGHVEYAVILVNTLNFEKKMWVSSLVIE